MGKFEAMEEEMRAEELDWKLEKGGDDQDHDEPDICPKCETAMVLMEDKNYGSDRDGKRGIDLYWQVCPACGYTPDIR